MKKYAIVSLVLVLTAALLTGCGCTRSDMNNSTGPSMTTPMLPTNIPETTVPTEPVTEPATVAPTEVPTESGTAGEDGGITGEIPEPTDTTRSRMR